MNSKTIEYSHNGFTGRVVVSEANVLQGMKRTRLRNSHGALDGQSEEVMIVSVITYPDLVAAAREIEINGEAYQVMTFEQFVALPEAFVVKWEEAAYDLNPHWLIADIDEAAEKKE